MLFKCNSILIKSRLTFNKRCFKRQFVSRNELINEKYLQKFPLIVCKALYEREGNKTWYLRSGPKTGIELNVECVDTKPNDKSSPTLVALHGCPGSHMDFTKLIERFSSEYRVIVPNFPDFSVTQNNNCFWHSAKEKAQYVRDVLKALDVQRINCLIAHSSAIFPASHLWLKDDEINKDFEIKSLCLLSNPGPKWFSRKGRIASSLIVNSARVQPIRQYLRDIWSYSMTKRLGLRNRIDRYDDLALLLSTFLHSETKTIEERLKKLNEYKIPTLSVFSSRDRLFKEEIFYSLYEILDIDYENYDIFEEHQNRLIQKSTIDDWIKVVDIRSGGHFVFSTHSQMVHNYIEELLQKVKD